MFKKEKSWIRFYSLEPGVPEVVPIIPAHKMKRAWMQRNDPPDPDNGNMHTKNCPGITKLVSMGYVLRAPADFIIKTDVNNNTTFNWVESKRFNTEDPGNERYIGFHNQYQTEHTLDDPSKSLKVAVKIDTPWRVKASDDIVLLQVPIAYNNEPRFTAAQGILDPRFSHVVNVQLYWHVLDGETLVKAGTPLVQYIPIQRNFGISNIDLIIDDATQDDKELEKAFNYCNNSIFLKEDNMKSRLQRTNAVMTKYKHRRNTLWTSLQKLTSQLLK
tara:strand:- start:14333 stop:15151 length:819 start_codon:yes stop_codon:yes gene_type:complete